MTEGGAPPRLCYNLLSPDLLNAAPIFILMRLLLLFFLLEQQKQVGHVSDLVKKEPTLPVNGSEIVDHIPPLD